MNRVREVLARQRAGLLDRWDRQLRAAAWAGFALDAGTAEVLPALLDAVDRALERRYRPVPPGIPPAQADGRRAALQSSLLGDFLFDAALESMPGMDSAEQRVLGEALAHAAVEVLVTGALEREARRRRREAGSLARLAHDLRNAATAVRLAVDLLKRQGSIPDSRAGRLLEAGLGKLQDGIEHALLDEILSAGSLRTARVRLAPLLADMHSAASELGAVDKNLTLLFQPGSTDLSVKADPRVVRPAMRGLLRAAVQMALPGATIRVGAVAALDQARVAVEVDGCRKLRGNRLPDLPALALARLAARAQGGSLKARLVPDSGCEFSLALPRVQPH